MRKLKTSDIPAFCRCLKNIGIKDAVRSVAESASSAKDAWDKGFDLIWNIFDLATENNGEKHLYDFLAGPFEMAADEVKNMDFSDFSASIKRLAAENDLATFFRSAKAVMK